MNILIFDTETINLEKPFCYNVGYIIKDIDNNIVLLQKEYLIEQVWHNSMLFSNAYYSDKKPIYIKALKGKTIEMKKFGYVCQKMIRDIKKYNVEMAFAFNSNFDEKVFDFNCNWFKCNNPFDTIEIKDIRAFVHHFLIDDNFKSFCEQNGEFTENGNYSTTAETMFRYISKDYNFNEQHTALSDSIIECDILTECIKKGANLKDNYTALKSIKRDILKTFRVIQDNKVVFEQDTYSITYRKTNNTIILK